VINRNIALIGWILCYFVLPASGQRPTNPFDLQTRLPSSSPIADTLVNPFDIVTPTAGSTTATEQHIPQPQAIQPKKQLPLLLTLFNLLFFSFIATLLRSYQYKVFQAFLVPNFLMQLYREREVGVVGPFFIMYAFFLFNAAFFTFQLFDGSPVLNQGGAPLVALSYFLVGISAIIFGKHLLLWLTGQVFPLKDIMARYSFIIMIFYIVLGFYLAAANLFLSYGTEWLTQITPVLSIVMAILILTYRQIRSFILAIRFFAQHKFHFLLYICTVEFVPFILLTKFLQIYF
jgi:hypothetical protein